ncbi:hypothetical protein CL634_10180 [bacterium]|nr:hypothetical protein [bacterium]
MRVYFYKITGLANNPDVWAGLLKQYKNIDTAVGRSFPASTENGNEVHLLAKECDFVHFNNTYQSFHGMANKSLMHYHGHPDRENDCPGARLHKNFPHKVIINPGHFVAGDGERMGLEACDSSYEPFRWFPIDLNSEFYDVTNPTDKIRICYTPSKAHSPSAYHGKAYNRTVAALQRLQLKHGDKFEYVVVTGQSYGHCLKTKALCNVVIDECISGCYNMSGMEGVGMGKLTIGFLSDATKDLLLKRLCPRAERAPYESVYIDELETYLDDLIEKQKLDFILQRGKDNKEWMEKNWNLNEMLDEMISRYENIMKGDPK